MSELARRGIFLKLMKAAGYSAHNFGEYKFVARISVGWYFRGSNLSRLVLLHLRSIASLSLAWYNQWALSQFPRDLCTSCLQRLGVCGYD
jgi:hypothetical protein